MKRLLIILLGLTLSFAVVSCESNGGKENIEDNTGDNPSEDPDDPWADWIVEYYPFPIIVSVCDAEGNDLLDSASPNAINLEGIKMLYNGEEYTLNKEQSSTRAWPADFYGIKLEYNTTKERYELWMGEFEGGDFYDNVDIIIDWGDGSSDTITLYNKIVAPYDGDFHIDQRFYLNGEQVEYYHVDEDSYHIEIVR